MKKRVLILLVSVVICGLLSIGARTLTTTQALGSVGEKAKKVVQSAGGVKKNTAPSNPSTPPSDKSSLYLGRLAVSPVTSSAAQALTDPAIAYMVTTTSDSGSGSLRQAITDANNNPGADSIIFNIPGNGLHTIQPTSELPHVTDSVTIDGYTQAGATPNTNPAPQAFNGTITIELRGDGVIPNGIRTSSGTSTIRGLAIGGFQDNGIYVRANNTTVAGSYIGTNSSGQVDSMNPVGVNARDVTDLRIGGSTPAERNVISGNRDMNIILERADNSTIFGNYIGIAANGGLLPNNAWYGIGNNSSSDVRVGSSNSNDKNVISANQVQSGYVSSVDATIAARNKYQGNFINTNILGQSQDGYASLYAGMGMGGNVQETVFGGIASGEGNTVGGMPMYANIGVGAMAGTINRKNSFVGNTMLASPNGLAIELGEMPADGSLPIMGRNPNDANDEDGGSNDHLNYPVLNRVLVDDTMLNAIVSLDIKDNTPDVSSYRLEFYANDTVNNTGDAGGQYYLGSTTVNGDVTGQAVSLAIPNSLNLEGKYITATTTELDNSIDGLGSTSEFSAPNQAVRSIRVTNTNDAGSGSLRQAITEANDNPGADTITFAIPGAGVHTIRPETSLPVIEETTTIDGYSQPGTSANTTVSPQPINSTLRIEIDGSNLPLYDMTSVCLRFKNAHYSVIRGIVINRCGNSGIELWTSNHVSITGNFIGTDANGYNDLGAGRDAPNWSGNGINGQSSNHMMIGGTNPADRNIIAGNSGGDIYYGNETDNANMSGYNTIQGNYVGVARDGVTALPSGSHLGAGNAILSGNSHHDQIGGTAVGAGNLLASSYEFGISWRDGCSFARAEGNLIGTDYTGTRTMPHALGTGNAAAGVHTAVVASTVDGMNLTRPPHDIIIGGSVPEARNIISGNSWIGGQASGAYIHEGSYNVTLQGNYIGTDITGELPMPNSGDGVNISSDNPYETHNNLVANNVFYSHAGVKAIAVYGAPNNTIQDNKIGIGATTGDTLGDRSFDGIFIDTQSYSDGGGYITGNTIAGVSTGITVNGHGAEVHENSIRDVGIGMGIRGSQNTIGAIGRGNTITAYDAVGLMLEGVMQPSNNNTVRGNTISNRQGQNQGIGVLITGDASENKVGGVNPGEGNSFINNNGPAIGIMQSNQQKPAKNSLLGNIVVNSNPGIIFMIDANGDGQPEQLNAGHNDLDDIDEGPNELLNTINIRSATLDNQQLTIHYDLDIQDTETAPHGYRIELFANTSNQNTSEILLGSTTVVGDISDGVLTIPTALQSSNYWITATVTEMDDSSDGFGSSSELSTPRALAALLAGLQANNKNYILPARS